MKFCRVGVLAHQIFSENVVGEYTHPAKRSVKACEPNSA